QGPSGRAPAGRHQRAAGTGRRGPGPLRTAPGLRLPGRRRVAGQPAPRAGRVRRVAPVRAEHHPPGRAGPGRGRGAGGPAGPLACLRGYRHPDSVSAVTSLAQRLGYGPDDRLLIINCDDLGSCHAANVGTYEALREGVATSATLMVPCPWSRDAASRYRGEDVGVHLTLNAEHERYRWGPITHAPSLLDGDGGFPRTITDVWDHADLDEVRRELQAQIERAILWGFDVSHLDSHMGTVQLRPEFFDVYLD